MATAAATPIRQLTRLSREELLNVAQNILKNVCNKDYVPRAASASPVFRTPGRFSQRTPSSKAKLARVPMQIEESKVQIEASKTDFSRMMPQVTDFSYASSAAASEKKPLNFKKDLPLKFQVLSELMTETGMDIPATSLSQINTINDAVDLIVMRRDHILASRQAAKAGNNNNTGAVKFPSNVVFVQATHKYGEKPPKAATKQDAQE